MTDKLEMEIVRGADAEQLLANPLLREAFELIEQDLIEKWQTSSLQDEKGREKLYLSQIMLARIVKQIELVVQTGQVAKATLAQRTGRALSRYF